jgi:EAL domain-containing protein (putative c-di-GMP-specific phosphodiesterase class I)
VIRWNHPEHGQVMPDRFIPIAEESGVIDAVGAWVLESAVAQVRRWADAGIPPVRVSVNISARQFESCALPRLVDDLLRDHAVDASSLEVEVTESAIMQDVSGAAGLLGELRGLGVRVAIDDFGTGYTSFGFLKRFPVDALKIDRSFVAGVARGAFDNAVVRAVTTLARGLNVRTVAEGVEAEDQFERLRALDCDVVQGYLFSRPLTVAACTPLISAMLPA